MESAATPVLLAAQRRLTHLQAVSMRNVNAVQQEHPPALYFCLTDGKCITCASS